jgi:hypothetical protein
MVAELAGGLVGWLVGERASESESFRSVVCLE